MKPYSRPELHFVRNAGRLSGSELATLPDDALAAYLRQSDFLREKKRYRISSGYVMRAIAGQYAIVPVSAGKGSPLENSVMAPNDTAVFIWKVFEQPSTIEDAVVRGLSEYAADERTLRHAMERFVAESLANQVLEEVDGDHEEDMDRAEN